MGVRAGVRSKRGGAGGLSAQSGVMLRSEQERQIGQSDRRGDKLLLGSELEL